MGHSLPRPARRGDHIWGKMAQDHFDETRRTGFPDVGPLKVRASRFVSPAVNGAALITGHMHCDML